MEKLRVLKIEEKDITISSQSFSGQVVISVEAPIANLRQAGKDIVSAVEAVLGRSQTQGVWFTFTRTVRLS
jgi:hypothetical protein